MRLTGVLVACEQYEQKWLMELDDGSGAAIDIIYRNPTPIRAPALRTSNTTAAGLANAGTSTAVGADAAAAQAHGNDLSLGKNVAQEQHAPHGASQPQQQGLDMTGVEVGSVVKVKGTISRFRGVRQIDLKRISTTPSSTFLQYTFPPVQLTVPFSMP